MNEFQYEQDMTLGSANVDKGESCERAKDFKSARFYFKYALKIFTKVQTEIFGDEQLQKLDSGAAGEKIVYCGKKLRNLPENIEENSLER